VNVLARIISVLFHPLLMATWLFWLLSLTLPSALLLNHEAYMPLIVLIFMITFLLPAVNLGIFKIFGTISSFTMHDRRERIFPFLLISLIYVLDTYLLFYYRGKIGLSANFLRLMMIIDLLVIVSTLATFFFKVSVHAVGIWGLIGITLLLTKISEINTLFYSVIVLIVLAGLIMSARLQLHAHNSREVMWGGVLGLATSITGMLILF
jgi:hypothetical protein